MNSRAAPAAPPTVPSPCTGVCRIEADTGWCEGCRRTLDEIAAWASFDNRQKRAVWKALGLRRRSEPHEAGE